MRLDLPFILNALSQEASWKPGDQETFFFDNWNLSLKREEDLYKPFTFSVSGSKRNSNETINRRYTCMEKAFLHILNRFNENAYIEDKFKSLSDITERFPEQHGLHLVDTYSVEDQIKFYSVSLEPGYIVDVKVFTDTGLVYVMQNHDGSTVYGDGDNELTFPDYSYNENAVIKFVKDEHQRRKWQTKPLLSSLIQSASTRIAVAQSAGKGAEIESTHER